MSMHLTGSPTRVRSAKEIYLAAVRADVRLPQFEYREAVRHFCEEWQLPYTPDQLILAFDPAFKNYTDATLEPRERKAIQTLLEEKPELKDQLRFYRNCEMIYRAAFDQVESAEALGNRSERNDSLLTTIVRAGIVYDLTQARKVYEGLHKHAQKSIQRASENNNPHIMRSYDIDNFDQWQEFRRRQSRAYFDVLIAADDELNSFEPWKGFYHDIHDYAFNTGDASGDPANGGEVLLNQARLRRLKKLVGDGDAECLMRKVEGLALDAVLKGYERVEDGEFSTDASVKIPKGDLVRSFANRYVDSALQTLIMDRCLQHTATYQLWSGTLRQIVADKHLGYRNLLLHERNELSSKYARFGDISSPFDHGETLGPVQSKSLNLTEHGMVQAMVIYQFAVEEMIILAQRAERVTGGNPETFRKEIQRQFMAKTLYHTKRGERISLHGLLNELAKDVQSVTCATELAREVERMPNQIADVYAEHASTRRVGGRQA